MPIFCFLRRERSPTDSFPRPCTRKRGTSATCFPSGRLFFVGLSFSRPTASCFSATLTERTSLPTASRSLISWPWPWAPQFTDSWACSFPILWPGSTLRNAGNLGRQLASRLYVLQSGVVARPFRLRRGFFSVVLGAHARLANFSPMDFAGPGFRADARRLFCQRRFPGPPFDRIARRLWGCLENTGLSRSRFSLRRKLLLPAHRDSLFPSHAHHALHYFWRILSLWLLSACRVGLDRSSLAFHPLLFRTRHIDLDSHSRACHHRPLFCSTARKGPHLLPFCRRRRFLLPDLLLPRLEWHIGLWKPLFYLRHAHFHFWFGASSPAP